ncbi:purine-cytosine permease family protein [Streptomyces sp. NRRL F-5123]|uniref:purine-cytosine permease family protein n=1 Tax=Streptomyces sp. NRRL F-5123 TaxID=1463856 RepID=UPI00099C075D|nr:cytosine permease [Streptomyces sp. NRRL F-5123]
MSNAAQQGRRGTTVESNGVNPVPDAERRGQPRGLFAVWFAWNISILGVSYGIFVFGLGLNVWQTIVAGTIGYLASAALVGILAVGGPRTGLPTLTQTRFAFGIKGNRIPAFFAYLSNMGWKVTIITLASSTGAHLFAKLWPSAFARDDGSSTTPALALWFVVVLAVTMTVAVLGHQLIMRIEVWISWLTGVMTVAFLGFVLPEIEWSHLGDPRAGGPLEFVGGVIMAMTLVGLGFLNYGGDFARYLPRETRARGVVGWTVAGLSAPVVVMLVVGALLVGGDPKLGGATAADPVGALTALLPMWFFVPFSVVIVISLVSAAITGMYSSGLALMAVGVPLRRSATTAINATIIAAGAFYLEFVSTSFLATFQSFLSLIAVMMGSMGAIQLVDFVRQRRLGWNTDLAEARGYGGRDGRWTAITSLVVATVLGLGLVTSSDPNFAKITGFLLTSGAQDGVFGASGLGIVIAMAIAGALYALLTFGLRLDPKPDYSLATSAAGGSGSGSPVVPPRDAPGRAPADATDR